MVCDSRWRGFVPTSACPNKDDWSDSNFSQALKIWLATGRYLLSPFPYNTENFRSSNRNASLKILQSKTCEKAKPPAHGHRSHRTQFLPLFVQLALSGSPTESVRSWRSISVQTAYVRFKVQYEESRTQCGHYNLLLSATRITLFAVV